MSLRIRTISVVALAATVALLAGRADVGARESAPAAPPPVPAASVTALPAAAPLELRMLTETTASLRFVRLRDLVEVRSDRDGVFPAVADTVVRVHDGRFVRRADVARRLERAGLAAGAFRVTGPALCDWRPDPAGSAGREAGR